jgi:RHS repeat-associated protein
VVALLNSSGAVVERYAYDPFGAVTVMDADYTVLHGSSYAWVYLFQGGRLDTITGDTQFGARNESSGLGVWTSVDPKGFAAGDTNLYRFVGDDPTSGIDPTGLTKAPTLSTAPTPVWWVSIGGTLSYGGGGGTSWILVQDANGWAILQGQTVSGSFGWGGGFGVEAGIASVPGGALGLAHETTLSVTGGHIGIVTGGVETNTELSSLGGHLGVGLHFHGIQASSTTYVIVASGQYGPPAPLAVVPTSFPIYNPAPVTIGPPGKPIASVSYGGSGQLTMTASSGSNSRPPVQTTPPTPPIPPIFATPPAP